MTSKPALVIYSFAPKRLPLRPELADKAHGHLQKLWKNCEALAMTRPLPGLTLPTTFPSPPDFRAPHFRILAARTDLERKEKGEYYQAFLFEYQDIFGLIAMLELSGNSAELSEWKSLLDQWKVNAPEDLPPGLMDETYLFTALHHSVTISEKVIETLGPEVARALPKSEGEPDAVTAPFITESGCAIWGGARLDSRRTIAVIAPETKETDLFHWTVWNNPHAAALAPFARYLMHASKLRFAQSVFETDIIKLHTKPQSLDQAVTELVTLYKRSEEQALWSITDLIRAHHRLIDEQTEEFDLVRGLSKLKELIITTRIAVRNMHNLVPRGAPDQIKDGTIFQLDQAQGAWLKEQMTMDLGYLRAARQRTQEGHRIALLLVERESQRTGRRLNSLVLLQGTLVGSLTIGLLMLPAFEVFHIAHSTVWALTVMLMGAAVALPPLFAHWHENYQNIDRVVGGLAGSALIFAAVTLWKDFSLPAVHVSDTSYNLFRVFSCVVGFLISFWLVGQLEKLKRSVASNSTGRGQRNQDSERPV